MSYHPISISKSISPDFIKALENEESDFAGKKSGSFQIIASEGTITVRKVQSYALEKVVGLEDSHATPKTGEVLKGESLDKAIDTLVMALNEEAARIQKIAKEQCISGNKITKDSFEISLVQESCLSQLKTLANSVTTKGNIEELEKSLAILKEVISRPHDMILKEALIEGDLALATWAVSKGANPDVLNLSDPKPKLSAESIEWLKLVAKKLPFTPENLDHYAIKIGWGYKTTNLKLMESQLAAASKELLSCEAHVPPLTGVSDFEVWESLKKGVPELEELWHSFLDSFEAGEREKFTTSAGYHEAKEVPIRITPKGELILTEIRNKIENHFKATKYSSLVMQDWLKTIDPKFVIVRSTGKEDSDVAANAGGNESIPFVKPKTDDISEAIGVVVASYFGSKSITQRLKAGDQTIFTEKPFLPVLIQEMVCEPNLGGVGSTTMDIPRSGVLFTRQPGRAEGVVVINSALGSNEGVVSSQVKVDTYAVHPKGIYKIIRDKETRFVQALNTDTSRIHVGPIKNSSKGLRMPPALTDSIAQDLAKMATAFGKIYGAGKVKPMDMEYTILFKEKKLSAEKSILVPVIYPLQIRPLLSTERLKPSFLKLDEVAKLKKDNQVVCSTLLSGNCSTAVIDNPSEQVIFADDLPQALTKYQKLKDTSNIRLIVTRKTAPLTSHEAVTFSQTEVPIMPVEDAENYLKVKTLLEKSSKESPCFADPQRSLIVFGEGKKAAALVGEGLISYPGPREYSLPLKPREFSSLREGLTSEERALALANLFKESAEMSNAILNKKEDFQRLEKHSIRELFDKVAMGEKDEAKKALAVLNRRLLLNFLDKNREVIKEQIITGDPADADDFLKATIRVYEEMFYIIKNDLMPSLDDSVHFPPQSMNRLFYLKPLEALIFQEGSKEALNSFSFGNILQTTKGISELKTIFERERMPMDNRNVWLVAIGKLGYRSELRDHWYKFIAKLPPKEKTELIENLKILQELGMEEQFVNILFADSWVKNSGDIGLVYKSVMTSLKKEEPTFKWLLEKQINLKGLEEQVGNWGVPSFSGKNLKKLNGAIVTLGFKGKGYSEPEILSRYRDASPFARLALLSYTRRCVTCYDHSIKSLTGSSLFDDNKQKAIAFGEMLLPYNTMMETVMEFLSSSDKRFLMENSENEIKLSFNQYKLGLKNGQNYSHGDLFKEEHKLSQGVRTTLKSAPSWSHPVYGPMSKYFSSPGLLNICSKLSSTSEENAKKEFVAREEFNVDGFIPGSKLDRDYSVHWPATLEEYFTTFHQTMEKVVKHELTKNGMDLRIIPSSLQGTCHMFNSIYDITPSTINKSGEMLEITYEVPLRQHAAKVTFKMNAHKSDTPIIMEVRSSGAEESDRWKRTAVLASLMAHKLGLPFESGVPPQIYYNDPLQVSFAVEIPRDYPKMEDFLKKTLVMIKTNTMKDPAPGVIGKPAEAAFEEQVVRGNGVQFKDLLGINTIDDWKHLPGQFFADSLYLNLYLLDTFTGKGDIATVKKIIDNTIQGMQNYGLKDYSGSFQSTYATPATESLVKGMKASVEHLIRGTGEEIEQTKKKLEMTREKLVKLKTQKKEAAEDSSEVSLEEEKLKLVSENLEKQRLELNALLLKIDTI